MIFILCPTPLEDLFAIFISSCENSFDLHVHDQLEKKDKSSFLYWFICLSSQCNIVFVFVLFVCFVNLFGFFQSLFVCFTLLFGILGFGCMHLFDIFCSDIVLNTISFEFYSSRVIFHFLHSCSFYHPFHVHHLNIAEILLLGR